MAIDKVVSASITDSAVTSAKVASGVLQPNFRNIIINGDMSQSQRSTSVSSITGSGYNTVDRWHIVLSSLGTWTQSQSTDVPTGQGFATSLKFDCTTADASPGSGDFLFLNQKVEGQNIQYLKKGTSSAESTTLSFWVKSNKTGTYICELDDNDNTRNINKSYTISSADTWEKKEITFAGDTTGAFGNDNGNSLQVIWWLGAGSNYTSGTLNNAWESTTNANRAVGQVNLADSTSNESLFSGVQLEAGTAASDFEFLPVDVNMYRCKRYFYKTKGNQWLYSLNSGATFNRSEVIFRPSMRATPTSTVSFNNTYSGSGTQNENTDHVTVYVNGVGSGDTALQSGSTFDAEL
jgi:hypothetical protein